MILAHVKEWNDAANQQLRYLKLRNKEFGSFGYVVGTGTNLLKAAIHMIGVTGTSLKGSTLRLQSACVPV